jgi:hypothetical protein
MKNTVIGIFSDREHADFALTDLQKAGYKSHDISIITKDVVAENKVIATTGDNVVEGTLSGATTGGVLGGIAGVLMGVGVISLPTIVGLLIGGPMAAALGLTGAAALTAQAAATGALAGGLLGGFVGLGIPPEVAKVYEDKIREGAVLLAVPIKEEKVGEIKKHFLNMGRLR